MTLMVLLMIPHRVVLKTGVLGLLPTVITYLVLLTLVRRRTVFEILTSMRSPGEIDIFARLTRR